MAEIDIIIPLYNKEHTVRRTVESILNQTFKDWRLTIVNDGSTDQSLSVVSQFTDPRIRLVSQDNQGPGAARNRGIQMADSKYLAFLDADDQWHPEHLLNAVETLRKTEVQLFGSMYEEWPEKGDMTHYWAKQGITPGVYEFKGSEQPKNVLSFLFFFHVGNAVVCTEAAKLCGGFYDQEKCLLGEDTVFFAKMIFCHPFVVSGAVTVRHNRQDSGLSNCSQRPLDIFLKQPDVITVFCPVEKLPFIRRVLAWHALRTAHFRVRSGHKADAVFLRERFPDMSHYRVFYFRLCLEIAFSRWLPLWVRSKCRIGTLLRGLLKRKMP